MLNIPIMFFEALNGKGKSKRYAIPKSFSHEGTEKNIDSEELLKDYLIYLFRMYPAFQQGQIWVSLSDYSLRKYMYLGSSLHYRTYTREEQELLQFDERYSALRSQLDHINSKLYEDTKVKA